MLKILYENKNVVVVLKPHGVLSQSGANEKNEVNMLDEVSSYIGEKAGLLHRLDRPTGGIMVFSKNKSTEGRLGAAISDKSVCIKEYLAVVSGRPDEDEGEMRDLLFKDTRAGKSFVVFTPRKGAKEALLSYKVLGSAIGEQGELSLLRIKLGTGRTHQIRAQFSSRHMPVVGDGKYGSRERIRGDLENGISPKDAIALYAFRLALDTKEAKFDVSHLPNEKIYPFSLFSSILTGDFVEKGDNTKKAEKHSKSS